MTWSIVAHDPETGAFAVAVSTCNFAVGASCPFVRSGVGAVSTQSFTNRYLAPAILDGLERGLHPADAIQGALAGDRGAGIRQVHAVDRLGRSAAWTGGNCVEWCGDSPQQGFSVAGNMLAGPQVIAETARAYEAGAALPFPRRLITAMKAGEDAGGDKRGKQSAALLIYSTEDYSDLDLRVDDHPEPLEELARLEKVSRERWVHFRKFLPKRGDPVGETDRDVINAGIDKALASES